MSKKLQGYWQLIKAIYHAFIYFPWPVSMVLLNAKGYITLTWQLFILGYIPLLLWLWYKLCRWLEETVYQN
ncbi:MAG: hypothetical protein K0R66_326 [Gammaproteobacteria bacterium]|nr:hypothetical protein [Gammaproteobacteria bacterium]